MRGVHKNIKKHGRIWYVFDDDDDNNDGAADDDDGEGAGPSGKGDQTGW